MCGISGIINNQKKQYFINDLKSMTDSVNHRGPNDVGYITFDETGKFNLLGDDDTPLDVYKSDVPYTPALHINQFQSKLTPFTIALGHRRLSIIDLSPSGHLPMSYNDGRYWITFNGEIYNFKDIKNELLSLGYVFFSHTDTEVILASYAHWGAECLNRFNGMWSFCIYDSTKQEIFLARDRFGIKPLYYWVSPKATFCFASEIKQFTFLPDWKAKINGQRAFDYLMYNMTDHTDETMFKGVFHIPAGHYYKCNIDNIKIDLNGKIKPVKWYQIQNNKYKGSFKEAAITFEKYFKNSVKEHLISDVPIGTALSGGLDSSAIVCEINNLLHEEGKADLQQTFSYCSSDSRNNEKKWIDEVIKVTNLQAHFVYVDGNKVFKNTEQLIWYNDEPTQSQSLLASFEVYKKANESNIRVLINGQGADEYLSGYGAFNSYRWVQLFKKLKFKKLNFEISNAIVNSDKTFFEVYSGLSYYFIPNFIKKYFRRNTKKYKYSLSLFSMDHLRAYEKHPYDSIPHKSDTIFNIASKQLFYDPLQKYLRFEDRMSMANSIEARVPFLDHRLVEFSTQLPADYLDGMGEVKKIMLYGLKNILPTAILNRKDKIGFMTSEEKWVKEEYSKEFREMLKKSVEFSKGILKPEVLQYFNQVITGNKSFTYDYWRYIQFGLWMKKFDIEL